MGGSLEFAELEEIFSKYPAYLHGCKLFFETGTYKGVTTRAMAKHFDRVITTEIMKRLWAESIETGKAEKIDNITYHLGDSVVVLTDLKIDESAVFFIDAHISGSDSGYNGKKLVPLLDELDVILTHNRCPSIYIIDDCRFFHDQRGKELNAWDWTGITEQTILEVFKNRGQEVKDSYCKNDRFFVLT